MPWTNAIPLRAGKRQWFALVILMIPVLLISIDNTVLTFALPSISRSLEPSGVQLLWMVDVYPLVLAGLLVPMGAIGDRIGRQRILLIGCSGFAVVSGLAALAPAPEWLVAARAGLGFFGAMLMPATLSLLRNIFLDPAQRRTAIAVWASGFSAGAVLGPILGGFLLEHFFWGSIFLIAIPLLIPALVLLPLLVPNSKDPEPGPVDPWSIALIMVTMVGVVYAIKELSTSGLGLVPVLALLVGLGCGVLFVRRQLSAREPMLDVRLFRNPVFTGSLACNFTVTIAFVGFILAFSQYLQLVEGYSPMHAGILMIPGMVMTVVGGFVAVPLVRRIRPGLVVSGGLLANALGFLLCTFTEFLGAGLVLLMVSFLVFGFGNGAVQTLANDMILSAVPPGKAGAASAISETTYEFGNVMGAAVLGTVLTAGYQSAVEIPEGVTGGAAETAGQTLGGAVDVAQSLGGELGRALMDNASSAFTSGFAYAVLGSTLSCLVGAVITWATLRRVPPEPGRPAPSPGE
jgi:DHA2 family multidrug resistance protein-like MFS transporter